MKNTAAIDALEKRLAELERKGNSIVEVINDLRQEDGLPPRLPFGSGGPSGDHPGTPITSLRSDTFYGKKLQTAIREYLNMRQAQNLGPATPREIFDAITAGGYKFETKDDNVALVGMRALLRKRTAFFHKLPNGAYGLTSWYPDLKRSKSATADADDDEDESTEEETATSKKPAAA